MDPDLQRPGRAGHEPAPGPPTRPRVSWRRTLWIVWFSQFLAIMGFSLCLPFAPYYIQHLGVRGDTAVKFWSALSLSVMAGSSAVVAPVWGLLADRYGRKLMLLRANFSAVLILSLMAWVPNVQTFIVLRGLQGFFTGTITAAMTLVACVTPAARQGTALGTLSTAVFSGATMGAFVGGLLAEGIGYRNTFLCAGGMLLVSALLVLFWVQEEFRPAPHPDTAAEPASWKARLVALGPGAPILILIFLMAVARQFDGPILPLLVQELHGGLKGAARWSGAVAGAAGVGAMLAGLVMGRLTDRVPPAALGRLTAVGAGAFMLAIAVAPNLPVLLPIRCGMTFCAGGIEPVFNVWLARATPESRRGTMFGWAVTAKCLGWVVTPLFSATVAVHYGNRAVYLVGPVLFWALVPAITSVARRVRTPAP